MRSSRCSDVVISWTSLAKFSANSTVVVFPARAPSLKSWMPRLRRLFDIEPCVDVCVAAQQCGCVQRAPPRGMSAGGLWYEIGDSAKNELLCCMQFPRYCRNQSSSVMLRQELTSTGVSSKLFKNNYLKTPNCLREAGARVCGLLTVRPRNQLPPLSASLTLAPP